MRLAVAQINTCVGDLTGNRDAITKQIEIASGHGADMVVFPELALCGYPPEDLVFDHDFLEANWQVLNELAGEIKDVAAVIGFVANAKNGAQRTMPRNAIAVLHAGAVVAIGHKTVLPNYGVFDERRTFTPGNACQQLSLGGVRIALSICEDIWDPSGPLKQQIAEGAQMLVNVSASPYEPGKYEQRIELVRDIARRHAVWVVLVNQIGGQDELIFDGGSVVCNSEGELVGVARRFQEQLLLLDIGATDCEPPKSRSNTVAVLNLPTTSKRQSAKLVVPKPPCALDKRAEIYAALVLGTHDFVKKCGFDTACVAISGGIDSALTACIAVDALGAANVGTVYLPSRYSSAESGRDAAELAHRLGVELSEISIEEPHTTMSKLLAGLLEADVSGVVDENLQARIRAVLMMGISNARHALLLATSNKSETATGYTTLYGDMAGGLAVIKDVSKSTVWELANWRNQQADTPIPRSIIDKPPSAELKHRQLDQDSLPSYRYLDAVLDQHISQKVRLEQIVENMHSDSQAVQQVAKMVANSEFKRRQASPGLKVSAEAFGRDRRMPLASRWGR